MVRGFHLPQKYLIFCGKKAASRQKTDHLNMLAATQPRPLKWGGNLASYETFHPINPPILTNVEGFLQKWDKFSGPDLRLRAAHHSGYR